MADRDRPAQLASSEIISEIGNQMLFLDPMRRQEGLQGVACSADRGHRRFRRCCICLFLLLQEPGKQQSSNFEVTCFGLQILR